MRLSVATIISRAVDLQYPIIPMLLSIQPIADELVINVDSNSQDGTHEMLSDFLIRDYHLFRSPWNWNAQDQGQELARQTNITFDRCEGDWILYIQADEIVHEDDHDEIVWLMENLSNDYGGAEFLRLYFYKNLRTLRADWTLPLIRLFRNGQGVSVGDAMDIRVNGSVMPTNEGLPRLMHYSRVGTPKIIAKRIHSLDGLYHPKENLRDPTEYDFEDLREYDNHSIKETPKEVSSDVLIPYTETHPAVILPWLREKYGVEP